MRPTRTSGAAASGAGKIAGVPRSRSASPVQSRTVKAPDSIAGVLRAITPGVRMRPLEALNFGALLALSVLTLVFYGDLKDPGEILLRFALMGGFLALIVFLVRRTEPPPAAI